MAPLSVAPGGAPPVAVEPVLISDLLGMTARSTRHRELLAFALAYVGVCVTPAQARADHAGAAAGAGAGGGGQAVLGASGLARDAAPAASWAEYRLQAMKIDRGLGAMTIQTFAASHRLLQIDDQRLALRSSLPVVSLHSNVGEGGVGLGDASAGLWWTFLQFELGGQGAEPSKFGSGAGQRGAEEGEQGHAHEHEHEHEHEPSTQAAPGAPSDAASEGDEPVRMHFNLGFTTRFPTGDDDLAFGANGWGNGVTLAMTVSGSRWGAFASGTLSWLYAAGTEPIGQWSVGPIVYLWEGRATLFASAQAVHGVGSNEVFESGAMRLSLGAGADIAPFRSGKLSGLSFGVAVQGQVADRMEVRNDIAVAKDDPELRSDRPVRGTASVRFSF